jgi:hypothetical protein
MKWLAGMARLACRVPDCKAATAEELLCSKKMLRFQRITNNSHLFYWCGAWRTDLQSRAGLILRSRRRRRMAVISQEKSSVTGLICGWELLSLINLALGKVLSNLQEIQAWPELVSFSAAPAARPARWQR